MVVQIGCIECGVSSYPIGIYDTLGEAIKVKEAHTSTWKNEGGDGYVEIWVVNKEDPQYYWIWARNEKLTDGYTKDFAKDRWEENNEKKEENDEKLVHRRVIEKKIPIDDIVWLTNNLSSKEYIVLNR